MIIIFPDGTTDEQPARQATLPAVWIGVAALVLVALLVLIVV